MISEAIVVHKGDRAYDAADKAAWKMVRTKVTTAAGAAAVLAHITTRPTTGLFELGETDWHETASCGVGSRLTQPFGGFVPAGEASNEARRHLSASQYIEAGHRQSAT